MTTTGSKVRSRVFAIATIAIAAGCNTQRGWPDRAPGALGYAQFCEDDSSIECTEIATDFAVSSRFAVRVELSDGLPEEIESVGVRSASREFLEPQISGFVALQESEVALLAMGTREVIDYVLLALHDVDTIAVTLPEQPPIGDPFIVDATPFGDGTELAGELDYVWTSDAEGLEVVDEFARTGRAELLVTTQQEIAFEVSAGGHTERITFNAYKGPARTPVGRMPTGPGPTAPGGLGTEEPPWWQGGGR